MSVKFKETRRISASELRKLCVQQDWYTGGTVEEYEHLLLDLADNKENITTADIVEIAYDIINHSDNITEDEITSVMFAVGKIANTFFERVEE